MLARIVMATKYTPSISVCLSASFWYCVLKGLDDKWSVIWEVSWLNGKNVIHSYWACFACVHQLAATDGRKEYNIDDLHGEGCMIIVCHCQHSTVAYVKLLNLQHQLEEPEMNFCPWQHVWTVNICNSASTYRKASKHSCRLVWFSVDS
jgi:hypothetical protein